MQQEKLFGDLVKPVGISSYQWLRKLRDLVPLFGLKTLSELGY